MSLDSEGILFSGLSFEQASKREQIEASVDIGIALNAHVSNFNDADRVMLQNYRRVSVSVRPRCHDH